MATHAPTDTSTGRRNGLLDLEPITVVSAAFLALAVVFVACALVVALALPYGEWDAMSFGSWSRQIAEHWPHLRFANAGAADYHRPLFYFLQGTLWSIFGFHQALGRTLSLFFSVVLLLATAWIAGRTVRVYRRLAAGLAAVVVLLIGAFAPYVASGLSDIPAAAMVAVTGALVLAPRLRSFQAPAVAISAALALLAKPSALPALVGLAAAILIGSRAGLKKRGVAAGAVAVGTALGLVYDTAQARYVHTSLRDFLTTGTSDGFYAQLADANRNRVLLDAGWLGNDLRFLLLFALGCAVVRLLAPHRVAVASSFAFTMVWSWLGPHLAGASGVRVGILGQAGWTQQIAAIAVAATLLLALLAPADSIPERLQLARGLVWAAPPFVVWVLRVVYGSRLLAPAWPPLVALIVLSVIPAFAAAHARSRSLVAVPAVALVVLGAYAVQNINGLGSNGWHQIRAAGLSGLRNEALMRNIALGGDFSSELNALSPQVERGDRILTFDQRLRFYYLSQVDFQAPTACAQLPAHRLFVLLESDEVRQLYGHHAESTFWESCPQRLTKVDERPGAYAIFVNGALHPSTGGCGAPAPSPGLAVEFGPSYTTDGAAKTALARVVGLGFVQAHVEQAGCASYRVVETGIPDETVGKSVVGEAATAQLAAKLVKR